jgi:hypothetical protein
MLSIKPADKYLTFVVPAKAGHVVKYSAIQQYYWMPDQVRHDGLRLFNRRVNKKGDREKSMLRVAKTDNFLMRQNYG